mmetsp:Transcript_37047/g.108578  ORF Transcript_37047/g.108578 Transcript_37047/m.108578 type:complete len:90 (-) Transcript_37047:446-715(-)
MDRRWNPCVAVSATASSLVNGIGAIGPIAQGVLMWLLVGQWGYGGLFRAMGALCAAAAVLLLPVARSEARRLSGGGGAGAAQLGMPPQP